MFSVGCPGSSALKTPELKIKKCPECGGEVEVFSTDVKVKCQKCGFTVYNDLETCIEWCQYAEKCVGPELVKKLKGKNAAAAAAGKGGK
jgi:ribosomal protein S27AE